MTTDYAMIGMTPTDADVTILLDGEDVTKAYHWLSVAVPERMGIRYKEPFQEDPDSGQDAIEMVRGVFEIIEN